MLGVHIVRTNWHRWQCSMEKWTFLIMTWQRLPRVSCKICNRLEIGNLLQRYIAKCAWKGRVPPHLTLKTVQIFKVSTSKKKAAEVTTSGFTIVRHHKVKTFFHNTPERIACIEMCSRYTYVRPNRTNQNVWVLGVLCFCNHWLPT